MRLDLLETYATVLATGSTQAAAQRLGLTQPAVSRRLAQFEASVGLRLFRREKARLVPTREGRMLQEQLQGLLENARRLTARAEELRSGNSPEIALRVAFPASLALRMVPQIVARFLASHDRVRIEVHTGPYDTIERMLMDARAEIGFLRVPVTQAGLRLTPVIGSDTVCVMPRGHPLAAKQRIGVQDLRGVPMILLARMRAPRRTIDDLFAAQGIRPDVRVEAHSVSSACGLAAEGVGVTLVNRLMAMDFAGMAVEFRPFHPTIRNDFAFATADRTPPGATAEAFIAQASGFFRALPHGNI
ncbi:LysR family transcriptional regulator [Oceaniglobus trochenteri]|uniref:LysR family transcriptional regulator n=1 Tax=Oceaniglobus trochenteri TaxID=2763260 RepID=UPI001CFF79B5|nr:LysR family transcriptional regulator [Oceaniglobus trochenteri]